MLKKKSKSVKIDKIKGSMMKWAKPNYDRLRKKIEVMQSRRKKSWKPKEGPNHIRILPALSDWKVKEWFMETGWHYLANISCPATIGKPCYVCRMRDILHKSDNTMKQALAEELEPKQRIMCWIAFPKDPEARPVLFNPTSATFDQLTEYWMDAEWGDFTHPLRGYNVNIQRKGTGQESRYKVLPSRKTTKIANKKWLEMIKDFAEIAPMPNKIQQKEAYARAKKDFFSSDRGRKSRLSK